jgi:hypothetical protein
MGRRINMHPLLAMWIPLFFILGPMFFILVVIPWERKRRDEWVRIESAYFVWVADQFDGLPYLERRNKNAN